MDNRALEQQRLKHGLVKPVPPIRGQHDRRSTFSVDSELGYIQRAGRNEFLWLQSERSSD